MAKQKARGMLVQINTSGSTYTDLTGVTTKSLVINNESVDITSKPSSDSTPLWAESQEGIKSMSLSFDGFFLDETAEATLNTAALSKDATKKFKIRIPDFYDFEGTFRITSLEFSGGDLTAPVTFSCSLESTGAVTSTTV